MSRILYIVLQVTVFTASVYSARILGVYPTPSISHQVVFRALTLELVKRGHEVVTITTDPLFKNKELPANLTEIDASDSYSFMVKFFTDPKFAAKYLKRGVIMDTHGMTATDIPFDEYLAFTFDNPGVKKLIEDKTQKFDLIILEGLQYSSLIFTEIFNAPAILFSSLYGTSYNYNTVGAVSRHPVAFPHMFRSNIGNYGIFDKIHQLYLEYKLWQNEQFQLDATDKMLKDKFGSKTPSVAELEKNVELLLVNSHPIFDGNRPVPPSTVYLGAVHMQPKKELPQDLKTYLDNSSRGVVYVSLGTNVRPSFMEKSFLDAFLNAFAKIPYDILWKFDGDNLDNIPKNVKIQKWFPQRDLLFHPNIKLFVMQGGLQSTDEAIDSEVPLVGIPMLGDQWFNTQKYVELGIGVRIDSFTMVAEDLVQAVNTVAKDPSFKKNIKKLKALMQDQPEKPIDRAVWWTEHVLRHKKSRHLIGASAKLSTSEYYMLDVVIFALVILSGVLIICAIALFYVVKFILSLNSKAKVKKH